MRFEQDYWSDGEIDRLRSMWAEGLSAGTIAQRLFAETQIWRSRNAVIGKARRLKLTPRKSPLLRDPNRPRRFERGEDMERLLTHPNEDLLQWDDNDE